MKLSTNRLDLVAATLDHVLAELESNARLAALLIAKVDSAWPPGEYDRQAQEFFRGKLQEGGDATVGWYSWYVILRGDSDESSVLVGAAGFLGKAYDPYRLYQDPAKPIKTETTPL